MCSRNELECCGRKFKSEIRQLLDEFGSGYGSNARARQSKMCFAVCDSARTWQQRIKVIFVRNKLAISVSQECNYKDDQSVRDDSGMSERD